MTGRHVTGRAMCGVRQSFAVPIRITDATGTATIIIPGGRDPRRITTAIIITTVFTSSVRHFTFTTIHAVRADIMPTTGIIWGRGGGMAGMIEVMAEAGLQQYRHLLHTEQDPMVSPVQQKLVNIRVRKE